MILTKFGTLIDRGKCRVVRKLECFKKVVYPVYDYVGRQSTYRIVLFFIWSKTGMLHDTTFKYRLHKFG